MVGTSKRRGFTLVEMLVVMSLLVAFGYLVFSLMRGSLELWRKGEAGRDLAEKSAAVFDLLERDLRAVHAGREGRILSDVFFELLPDGKTQSPARRLIFLRTVDRAEEIQIFRRLRVMAGEPGPEGEPRAEAPASGGLVEAAYAAVRDSRVPDPALQVLYRGLRPMGSALPSLFEEGVASDASKRFEALREVTAGVLYFGVAFGSGTTRNWEDRDESLPRSGDGPERCWDSTRGVLARDASLPANRFSLARGSASFADPRDDVYPIAIRLELVLERDAADSRLTFLAKPIGENEKEIEVDDPKRLPVSFPAHIKIDAEWIEISRVEGKTAYVLRRGSRSTVQAQHAERAKVHVGESFVTTIVLDRAREDWNAAAK